MAVLPIPNPPSQQAAESTTQQPTPVSHVQSEPVTIPLDEPEAVRRSVAVVVDDAVEGPDARQSPPRRPPSRRDSMKRREALLKGKEGSRRRQRWENDNFLNHPGYAPPTPDDFQPRPLYPQRVVRYEFAALWDPSNPAKYGYASAHHVPSNTSTDEKRVPKNLKDRLKRSKGAMDLLRSLEEEVRRYAASLWGCTDDHCSDTKTEEEEAKPMERSLNEEDMRDSEDEEIVFIPRMKTLTLDDKKSVYVPVLEPPLQKSVFEASPSDPGASFGRWLVHSIAMYYGLRSWSVTEGNPAMRIAFVGALPNEKKKRKAGTMIKHQKTLPRPLWMQL